MLEVKQFYIDTSFKTEDSKSDSDSTIELPNTINIPDDKIWYINDGVLPVSWTTIDELTNQLYYSISHYVNGGYVTSYWISPTKFKNYNGSTVAEEPTEKMNDGLYADMKTKINFKIAYTYIENQLNTELIGLRSVADHYYGHVAEFDLVSDADVLTDTWKGINLNKDDITIMYQVIRLTTSTLIKHPLWENIFIIRIWVYTLQAIYIHIVAF